MAGLATEPEVRLERAPPTELIHKLRAGGLDAALASVVEGFRAPGYRAAAGLGIACRGPVLSVRAFRRPGRAIRTVAVDASSASSVALLRVLLARRLGVEDYELRTVPPTRRPDALPDDVVMMIGDAGAGADPGSREVLDLGDMWHRWTGLPFVFAVWLISPAADLARLLPTLRAAYERGRYGVEEVSEGAVHYELGVEEYRGLERFRVEAEALGLVQPGTELAFVHPPHAD